MPTPILFYDDGSLRFDYKMSASVEKEFRRRAGHMKGRWRETPIYDQSTFNVLKDSVKWSAETIENNHPFYSR